MDEFPDNYNRKTLTEKLIENQKKLTNETRKYFYDYTIAQIDESEKTIKLDFPLKLWQENRIIITNEILEKFGEIAIITLNGSYSLTKITNDKNDIPNNIKSIKLDF